MLPERPEVGWGSQTPARVKGRGRECISRAGGHRERLFPEQRGLARERRSGRASAQLRASAAAGGARGPLRERGAQAKASGSCRFGSRQKPLTAFGSRAKPGVDPGQTNSRSAAAPHALELQPGAGGERRHRTQLPIQPGYCRGRLRSGTAQRSGPSPPRMGSVFLTGKEPSPSAAEPRSLLLRQVLALQSDADPCARSQHLAPVTVPRDAQPCHAVCVLTTATPADPPCPQHPA